MRTTSRRQTRTRRTRTRRSTAPGRLLRGLRATRLHHRGLGARPHGGQRRRGDDVVSLEWRLAVLVLPDARLRYSWRCTRSSTFTVEGASDPLCYSGRLREDRRRRDAERGGRPRRARARPRESLRADATEEVDEAEAEALEELADAEQEIEDGQAELDDGRAEVADGQAELDEQRADALAQLDDAQATIDDGRAGRRGLRPAR